MTAIRARAVFVVAPVLASASCAPSGFPPALSVFVGVEVEGCTLVDRSACADVEPRELGCNVVGEVDTPLCADAPEDVSGVVHVHYEGEAGFARPDGDITVNVQSALVRHVLFSGDTAIVSSARPEPPLAVVTDDLTLIPAEDGVVVDEPDDEDGSTSLRFERADAAGRTVTQLLAFGSPGVASFEPDDPLLCDAGGPCGGCAQTGGLQPSAALVAVGALALRRRRAGGPAR